MFNADSVTHTYPHTETRPAIEVHQHRGQTRVYVGGTCVVTLSSSLSDATNAELWSGRNTADDVRRLALDVINQGGGFHRYVADFDDLDRVTAGEHHRAFLRSLCPAPDRVMPLPRPHRRRHHFLRWRARSARSP